MIFCGHCGYQLGPNDRVCPNCGAATETNLAVEDPGTYNETVPTNSVQNIPTQSQPRPSQSGQSAPLYRQGSLSRPGAPADPEPLILRPSGARYNEQEMANDATTMMGTQQSTPAPPVQPPYPSAADYGTQLAGGYTPYPPQQQGYYNQPGMGSYVGYPGQPAYQGMSSEQALAAAAARRRGQIVSLLLILFGLLLLIGAVVILILQHNAGG